MVDQFARARRPRGLDRSRCGPRAGLDGRWDRLRIEQVVTNLLTNSLKYAAGTPVELDADGTERTRCSPSPTRGPGIPESEKERVFFVSSARLRCGTSAGWGWGSTWPGRSSRRTAARSASLRRGRHAALSFVIRLPQDPTSRGTARMSHTVLVVEDDVDIRQALDGDPRGARVQPRWELATGRRRSTLLSRAAELPCLILLDLMMPVMDGATFREDQRREPAARLASRWWCSRPTAIVEEARGPGWTRSRCSGKPPSVRELVNVLRTHC